MTTKESLDMIHIFYGIRQMYMRVWKTAEKMFSGGVPAPEVFEWCKHEYVENDAFLESWMEDFKQVYSAQPAQQWIPVSERLPEELTTVLITDKDGDVFVARFIEIINGCAEWSTDDVIAWMPLPEAYKERREEHD